MAGAVFLKFTRLLRSPKNGLSEFYEVISGGFSRCANSKVIIRTNGAVQLDDPNDANSEKALTSMLNKID